MPRIIVNRWLPPKGFAAINLCGFLFVRHGVTLDKRLINHERIHTRQMLELLVIPFYLWYVVEWLVLLCRCRNNLEAYRRIRFEAEAYRHDADLEYLKHRPFWAFMRKE